MDNFEEFIVEAKKYFSAKDWRELEDWEQLEYGQLYYIYFGCINLGIKIVIPDFMEKGEHVEELLIKTHNRSKCKYCNIVFVNIEENDEHMKNCKRRFDFIKKEKYAFDYSTDSTNNVKDRKLTYTCPSEKNYFCVICEKSFLTKPNLRSHMNKVHSKTEKKFSCDKCSFKTIYSSSLRNHIQIHSTNKPFICEICNMGFTRKSHLTRHSYKHNNKDKPFKCSTCDKSFMHRNELEDHMNGVHLKIKPFKCTLCEYSASVKVDLRKHSYTHLKEKPFKCNQCNYSSSFKCNLKKHRYVHSDIKPFECIFCDYRCTKPGKLDHHLQTKH